MLCNGGLDRMWHLVCGAELVIVVLPSLSPPTIANRKALLSGKQGIRFASHDEPESLSKIGMTKEVCTDSEHQSAQLHAKHFSHALTLSRLKIVSVVLEALASRHQDDTFSGGDVA